MSGLVDPGVAFRAELVRKAVENLSTLSPVHRGSVALGIYVDVCRGIGMPIEKAVWALRQGWEATREGSDGDG